MIFNVLIFVIFAFTILFIKVSFIVFRFFMLAIFILNAIIVLGTLFSVIGRLIARITVIGVILPFLIVSRVASEACFSMFFLIIEYRSAVQLVTKLGLKFFWYWLHSRFSSGLSSLHTFGIVTQQENFDFLSWNFIQEVLPLSLHIIFEL